MIVVGCVMYRDCSGCDWQKRLHRVFRTHSAIRWLFAADRNLAHPTSHGHERTPCAFITYVKTRTATAITLDGGSVITA